MISKLKENLTLASLLSITVLATILLTLPTVSAETEAVDTVTITVPSACSMSSNITTGNEHTATVDSGTYVDDIGETTLKTICNDSNGFSIYAIGYTDDTYGNTKLKSSVGATSDVDTGIATSGNTSNWAMKLEAGTGTYAPTTETDTNGSFANYHVIPSTYTKVASFNSTTDATTGSTFTTTYAVYMNPTQPAGTYTGKVKYTLVHPASEEPLQPQITQSGKIHYYANASDAIGTMGEQDVPLSKDWSQCVNGTNYSTNCYNSSYSNIIDSLPDVDSFVTQFTLLASNYSRAGYGFAGWSDKFDYATNNSAHFYGPQETISLDTADYSGDNNGLSLYAVWVKSAGSLQDSEKVAELCGTGNSALDTAPTDGTANLDSVSALTDSRDNQTYAIAKLADGKCWMIENLRLDNTAELTTLNTNNPLNDGANVTLKHNYTDTDTYNTLSATSSVAYDADTAPDGWCASNSAACDDQSRLITDNTVGRATNPTSNYGSMYSYGNYYNWYSATAGRGTYSFSTRNNSTAGDLCPAGWRLPIGGQVTVNATGDFYVLTKTLMGGTEPNNANGGDNYYSRTFDGTDVGELASSSLRNYPNNYLYSGYVNVGYLSLRGTYGYYWSSTAYNNSNAYHLYLDSSSVIPGTGNNSKYYGMPVRCVASS